MFVGYSKAVNDTAERGVKVMEEFKDVWLVMKSRSFFIAEKIPESFILISDEQLWPRNTNLKLLNIVNWNSNLKLLTSFERCRLSMFKIALKQILKFSKIGLI